MQILDYRNFILYHSYINSVNTLDIEKFYHYYNFKFAN